MLLEYHNDGEEDREDGDGESTNTIWIGGEVSVETGNFIFFQGQAQTLSSRKDKDDSEARSPPRGDLRSRLLQRQSLDHALLLTDGIDSYECEINITI